MTIRPIFLRVAIAALLFGATVASANSPSAEPTPAAACNQPVFLVLDAQSNRPRQVDKAARALARDLGTKPLFDSAPTSVLEGDLANSVLVVLPLACAERVDGIEKRRSWRRLLAQTQDTATRRAMVFAADPAHLDPTPATAGCSRDAWLGFKGWVSNRDQYFGFLRQVGQTKILDRYGAVRVVVMNRPGIVVRELGAPFVQGEYFELLRFPCAQRVRDLWQSAEFQQLAELRKGAVTVKAGTFEAN